MALERETEGCVIQSASGGELGKIWGDGIVVRQTEGFQEAQDAIVVKVEIGADILALERGTEGLLGEDCGRKWLRNGCRCPTLESRLLTRRTNSYPLH